MQYEEPYDYGPTDDEVESWAADERKRRQSWAAGPTDAERRRWAAAELEYEPEYYGPGTTIAVGPTDEEVDEWAREEHARRQGWLQGPTELEKQDWARAERGARTAAGEAPALAAPTDDEVAQWAEEERKRRQAWLEGPTEGEKQAWADAERSRRKRRRVRHEVHDAVRGGYWAYGPVGAGYEPAYGPSTAYGPDDREADYRYYGARAGEAAARLQRDLELAARGAWFMLTEGPYRVWDELVGAGQEWEEQWYGPAPRTRARAHRRY